MSDRIALADWRRRVAEMYGSIRRQDAEAGWEFFRRERDSLIASHPQSPLSPENRASFHGLSYFAYDPDWRLLVHVEPRENRPEATIDLGQDGSIRMTEVGRVTVRAGAHLSLYWIEGYGGGLFLPFLDATNGSSTYGGGRYLLDGIKGADLGTEGDRLILDFNFAYNPSCVYDERWVCPLSPESNRLPIAVEAGEKAYEQVGA